MTIVRGAGADWRADAVGLRGVAVLAVLIFHATPTWLSGGFAGVDVFFVLSGFLVARLIAADLTAGTFSYYEFYARRARRLFPALLLVLCVTLAAAPLFLVGEELRKLGAQIAASAAFAGNFLAWAQSGYFEGDAAYKPLLHLWSLGVEEQFYLLFPVCVVVLLRRSERAAAWFIGLAGVASFLACVALTNVDPDAAFYLPFTRFWELFAGAGLALAERRFRPPHGRAADAVALLGALVLIGSFVLLDEQGLFPGWRAAGPVVGAVLLLVAGPNTWLARTTLSRGPLPWLGDVSYAAYLWHWPLLVFARHYTGQPLPPALALGLTACAVLIAWRSTILLERPFRSGSLSQVKFATPGLVVAMAVVAVAAPRVADFVRARGEFIDYLQNARANIKGDPWRKADHCFVDINTSADFGASCLGGVDDRPLAVLWGDSHAGSLWHGLEPQADAHGHRIAQLTVSSCAPLIETIADHNIQCDTMRERALHAIARLKPSLVILSARWARGYPEDRILDLLAPTIAWLRAVGVERVVVLGPLPMWQPNLPAAVLAEAMKGMAVTPPEKISKGLYENAFDMTPRLRARTLAAGAEFVSPLEALCEGRDCRIWADPAARDVLMAYDDAHLTPQGSLVAAGLLADRIFGVARQGF